MAASHVRGGAVRVFVRRAAIAPPCVQDAGAMPRGPRHEPIPDDLQINFEPRRPEFDPTLNIDVEVDRSGSPPNRLVTIGDSLTHGFMSGAIFRTDLSWPAVVAFELGSF